MNTDPLQQPREEIDVLDAKIVALLGERWKLVEEVTRIKKGNNLPPLQPERFAELLEDVKSQARVQGVPEEMIEEMWHSIHKFSRRSQGETDAN
jgi:chorismate mutase